MKKRLLCILVLATAIIGKSEAQQVTEIGRIDIGGNGYTDVRGVKIGPDGKIWFVDYTQKKVVRIDNELIEPWANLDGYMLSPNTFTVIADESKGIKSPVDLDFNPTRDNELWVLNQGTENSGGITNIISDAGGAGQSIQTLQDGNAWHFMALATALAFGDNGDWATSQGILDANRNGSNFTGPTLWPGDLDIYTKVGDPPTMTVNGSHLDMLHQSPYSMGIAHEKDNVYWVFDGFNDNIVRYDFQAPHYPGGDDHSDAIVRRYTEVQVEKKGTLPAHLVVDDFSGLLFICDTDNGQILQLDIYSGNFAGNLAPANGEPLAEYSRYENVDWGVTVDGLQDPVGIDVSESNYMVVSDNSSNELIIYNTQQITGIEKTAATAKFSFAMFPNPSIGLVKIATSGVEINELFKLAVYDQVGKQVYESNINPSNNTQIDLGSLPAGIYHVNMSNDEHFFTQKLVLK